MTKLKKYILPIAIILSFLSGALLNSGSKQAEKELEALRKKERQMFIQQIIKKQVEIQFLILAQREIERQRVEDSIRFAGALERNQTAYNRLKKKYNEINLNRATHAQLDSIVGVLLPND